MNDFPFACVHFGPSQKNGFSQGPGKRSVNWNVLLEPQPVLSPSKTKSLGESAWLE